MVVRVATLAQACNGAPCQESAGLLQVELVALGVEHGHPVLSALLEHAVTGGAEREQPVDHGVNATDAVVVRCRAASADVEVEYPGWVSAERPFGVPGRRVPTI